jgi:hypothetical protein
MLADTNTRPKKVATRVASDARVDEALWSAYQRYDTSADTEELLCRYVHQPSKYLCRRRSLSHG